jgi:16S rRNA (cytidine1402-2'-O)-methyltransferase
MPGTLFVVATPIGNLEDVSARALRVLREVAVVAAEDTRRTAKLFSRYSIQTPLTSLHAHNEASKAGGLVERLAAGESVALVSDAGTPTVSDPGGVLVAAAIEASIDVVPVPGPNAALALLSVAGLPMQSFVFLGFPPTGSSDRIEWMSDLVSQDRTAVFYESPHRIVETLESIRAKCGECHIVVGRELTKVHEEVLRGSVSSVLERIGTPRGEFCVAVMVGHTTEHAGSAAPSDEAIASEFGLETNKTGITRRKALSAVSRKLGLPPNVVYAAIERVRNSIKQQN